LGEIMARPPGSGMAHIDTRRRDANILAERVASKLKAETRTVHSQS
jgi:hypothetical protein